MDNEQTIEHRKCVLRLTGEVAVRKDLGRIDRVLGGVKTGIDLIGDNSFGERLVRECGHRRRRGRRSKW